MEIVTRAEWGARPPTSVTPVPWSKRTEFIVHYSAASKTQTVKSIQNFHMDTNGWTDIGYNFLTDTKGQLYEGRGWDVLGTHTVGHNTSGIAICFIGTDADVTDAAKATIRALAEEADRLKGSPLKRWGHRDLDQTSCPGDDLWTWVHAGMPIEEDDMKSDERIWLYNASSVIGCIGLGLDSAGTMDPDGNPVTLDLTPYWARVAKAVAEFTPDQLAAITAAAAAGAKEGSPTPAELEAAAEAAVRKVAADAAE